MSDTAKKGGLITYITQAWLVILLGLLFGGALAGVEIALKDRIKLNKQNKTRNEVPKLFPEANAPQIEEIAFGEDKVLKVTSGSETVGWVLPGVGQGFADKIEILIGLNADLSKIVGISVIKQAETPGLGDYITHSTRPFRKDYTRGLIADQPVLVVKRPANVEKNEVQAITGATVSSDAVTKIVNATVAKLKPAIKEQGLK